MCFSKNLHVFSNISCLKNLFLKVFLTCVFFYKCVFGNSNDAFKDVKIPKLQKVNLHFFRSALLVNVWNSETNLPILDAVLTLDGINYPVPFTQTFPSGTALNMLAFSPGEYFINIL
jgi:hypothetical protein